MFSPSEVLELVMLCRQTAHSATDFSPMDGNAKLKKNGSQHIARERKKCRCTSIRLGASSRLTCSLVRIRWPSHFGFLLLLQESTNIGDVSANCLRDFDRRHVALTRHLQNYSLLVFRHPRRLAVSMYFTQLSLKPFGLRGLDKLAGILFDVFQRWLCSSKTFAHRLAMLGEASRLPSRGRSRTSRDNS